MDATVVPADAEAPEAGVCNQPPLTLPQCLESPPEPDDAGIDAAEAETGGTSDAGGDQ